MTAKPMTAAQLACYTEFAAAQNITTPVPCTAEAAKQVYYAVLEAWQQSGYGLTRGQRSAYGRKGNQLKAKLEAFLLAAEVADPAPVVVVPAVDEAQLVLEEVGDFFDDEDEEGINEEEELGSESLKQEAPAAALEASLVAEAVTKVPDTTLLDCVRNVCSACAGAMRLVNLMGGVQTPKWEAIHTYGAAALLQEAQRRGLDMSRLTTAVGPEGELVTSTPFYQKALA